MDKALEELHPRRCVSEPILQPLSQRFGPPIGASTDGDTEAENESIEDKHSMEHSRPYIGVSEMGDRARQRIPFIMDDGDEFLKLGDIFAPAEADLETPVQTPMALAVPGNPKPFLALFNDNNCISFIRESFYNEYFGTAEKSQSRCIPTERGILHYNYRSVVTFNRNSPLYIKEDLSDNSIFDINQKGSMQAIGLTMIPFCMPHDNTKTHWVQVLVVKELFPWSIGLQDDVMAIFDIAAFGGGVTYVDADQPVPMIIEDPYALQFDQDGSIQVWLASKHFTPAEGSIDSRYSVPVEKLKKLPWFGVGVYFGENAAFNSANRWYWDRDTDLRTEPLGDVVAILSFIRHFARVISSSRGAIRGAKGITIHISHTLTLGLFETIRRGGSTEKYKHDEAWFGGALAYITKLAKAGWEIKFKWVEYQNNEAAQKLAELGVQDMRVEHHYSDSDTIQKASEDLAASGTFDTTGISHDENTKIIQVIDGDWEQMHLPPFLRVQYEDPFDSLLRQIDSAEAELSPHYNNNDAAPEEDIFNPTNHPE
ncbi:hypothetical protein TWF694_002714 [Orbilia ellipsospora]|uniref:RNase H type-1 domain-containing protein n=1 Tax=Orbilia ellipsospora TaxID=2528407 RepID=A0AAV9X8W6_9PEZI